MTARVVPAPGVWGVGRVGSAPWSVSPADVADEVETAVEHLRILGVEPGGLVLIVSSLSETIHVAPLELAAGRLDARWSSADATEADASRTPSLIRQLSPDAVVGINETVVNALDNVRETFASVRAVAVTDEVAWRAVDSPRWWLRLGPTSAFECAARAGAHFDAARWLVDAREGEIVVSNLTPRLTPARALPTGVRGHVDTTPCSCGSAWPRVVIA